jgi:hypothetical protein
VTGRASRPSRKIDQSNQPVCYFARRVHMKAGRNPGALCLARHIVVSNPHPHRPGIAKDPITLPVQAHIPYRAGRDARGMERLPADPG